MIENKHEIHIGDTYYQANTSYNKVFAIEVIDIYVEKYLGGPKTIIEGKHDGWVEEYFLADILECFETEGEAKRALEGRHGDVTC